MEVRAKPTIEPDEEIQPGIGVVPRGEIPVIPEAPFSSSENALRDKLSDPLSMNRALEPKGEKPKDRLLSNKILSLLPERILSRPRNRKRGDKLVSEEGRKEIANRIGEKLLELCKTEGEHWGNDEEFLESLIRTVDKLYEKEKAIFTKSVTKTIKEDFEEKKQTISEEYRQNGKIQPGIGLIPPGETHSIPDEPFLTAEEKGIGKQIAGVDSDNEEKGTSSGTLEFFKKVNQSTASRLEELAAMQGADNKVSPDGDGIAEGGMPEDAAPGEGVKGKTSQFDRRDTSRKSIEEHTQEINEAMKTAFGNTEDLPDDQKANPPREGYLGSPDYKEAIDDQAEARMEETRRSSSESKGGFFGAPDYKEAIDDQAEISGGKGEGVKEARENNKVGKEAPDAVPVDLGALYERAKEAQKASDEAGKVYAEAKGREESLRTKVYQRFSFLRKKLEEEMIGRTDLSELRRIYEQKLTELHQIKIEIAKEEASRRGDVGKDLGKKMAQALKENEGLEAMRMAELWMGAKREDRRRMNAVKMAEDTVEWYRKLDPKVKLAVSAFLFTGAVLAGGVNVPLFIAALFPRGLGAAGLAGAGKQLHEKYALGKLSAPEKGVEWTEAGLEKLRQEATRPLEMFDTYCKKSRKRSWAWAGGGISLFCVGTGLSYAGLSHAAERVADGADTAQAIRVLEHGQTPVIENAVALPATGEVPPVPSGTPVVSVLPNAEDAGSLSGAMGRLARDQFGSSVPDPAKLVLETPPIGSGGIASSAETLVPAGQSAEVAKKIAETIVDTTSIPKGSSVWETVRQYVMEHGGITDKDEAEKITARIVNNFVNTNRDGVSLYDLSHVQPHTELDMAVNGDNAKLPFKIHTVRFAPVEGAGKVASGIVSPISAPGPSILESAQEVRPIVPSSVAPLEPAVEIEPIEHASISSIEAIQSAPAIETVSPNIPTPPASLEVSSPTSSLMPPDIFERSAKVVGAVGSGAMLVGGGLLAGAEIDDMRRRKAEERNRKKAEEITRTREENERFETMQKRANEVIDQVLSIVSFPNDRKVFLEEIRDRYGVYGDMHPSEAVFQDTLEKIAGVLFGSEEVLRKEDILGNMFLAVAQRGAYDDKEGERLGELRQGIQNGYSVFQGLFLRTGERIPKEKVEGLSVRDVLRLFTERFLTGKLPEELQG